MSNLYPPILESQRESIASLPLPGDSFSIPFTMPQSVVTNEIGHVQVLIRRQANLDSWSVQNRPVSVPEKETIYLPAFKESAPEHGENCLRKSGNSGDSLWYVDVPVELIRGIKSGESGEIGLPGFPAGKDGEGETFTVQIRFGDNPLSFTTTDTFADWKKNQVANGKFGEWSNTQRMFSYALPEGGALKDLFSVTVVQDPVAKINWSYTPVSIDPLAQVRLSYSWSTPDNYGNNFRAKNLEFESHDARGASAAKEVELNIMRFAMITATIQFTTVNGTSFTWVADSTNRLMDAFPFAEDERVDGAITPYPIVGEEIEDGVIGMTFHWQIMPETLDGIFKIYRVDASTLEVVLLNTIRALESANLQDNMTTTIKDYSVEMGAEYLYILNAYTADNDYVSTLCWGELPDEFHEEDDRRPLSPNGWNPPEYDGYQRQMDFKGNIFLTTRWQQLRLQGNVNVSSFQRNTSDQFTTTIGGQYPFYSRSAQFNYRTMSLQALVSMKFDTSNTFLRFKPQTTSARMEELLNEAALRYQIDLEELSYDPDYKNSVLIRQAQYYQEISEIFRGIDPLTGEPFDPAGTKPYWMTSQLWFREGRDQEELILRSTELFTEHEISLNIRRMVGSNNSSEGILQRTDNDTEPWRGPATIYSEQLARDVTEVRFSERQDELIYAERKFREAVMRWLSDGKPKLLRSETEGNMIVMVSGATFTPLDKSRQVYSLSATVTEVAEYNLTNLMLYDLIPAEFTAFYVPPVGFIPGDKDPNLWPDEIPPYPEPDDRIYGLRDFEWFDITESLTIMDEYEGGPGFVRPPDNKAYGLRNKKWIDITKALTFGLKVKKDTQNLYRDGRTYVRMGTKWVVVDQAIRLLG